MTKRFLLAATAIAAISAPSAHAELIYGITDPILGNAARLVSFDSATPGSLTDVGEIGGLVTGQFLRGIDFRPATGQLYALSSNGANAQLYTLNLATGAATTVGTGLTLPGNTAGRVSIDFNPVADLLRVVTGNSNNYRVSPLTGSLVATDTTIAYVAGDPNNDGSPPFIADFAYDNNTAGATSTTMYAWDYNFDSLVRIGSVGGSPNSPNGGLATTIFSPPAPVSGTAGIGMDISATGTAYVSFDNPVETIVSLYSLDLGTGARTTLGAFPQDILDISVAIAAPVVVPEAGTLALAGAGLMLGGMVLRRRKTA